MAENLRFTEVKGTPGRNAMGEIILQETLFKSHLEGLMGMFPPDQCKIVISNDKGIIIEASAAFH